MKFENRFRLLRSTNADGAQRAPAPIDRCKFGDDALPIRLAAVAGVDEAEARDQPVVDRRARGTWSVEFQSAQ